jgi:hypothetical protein
LLSCWQVSQFCYMHWLESSLTKRFWYTSTRTDLTHFIYRTPQKQRKIIKKKKTKNKKPTRTTLSVPPCHFSNKKDLWVLWHFANCGGKWLKDRPLAKVEDVVVKNFNRLNHPTLALGFDSPIPSLSQSILKTVSLCFGFVGFKEG